MRIQGQRPAIGWASILVMTCVSVTAAWAAEPTSRPTSAPRTTISVAVLNEPSAGTQGQSDMAMGELAKAMEAAPGLKVLDRDYVRKLLAEHQLSLAGLVQQPVKQGGMLGAKYFLYTQAQQSASEHTVAILCIQLHLLIGQQKWQQADVVVKRIRGSFAALDEDSEREVTDLAKQVSNKLSSVSIIRLPPPADRLS